MEEKQLQAANIIREIETASSFNIMGDWAMKLNEIEMSEAERRELFYTIYFPFNAKPEFFDGVIYIQEYPLEM